MIWSSIKRSRAVTIVTLSKMCYRCCSLILPKNDLTSLLLARNQITTYATMRNMSKSNGLREIASKEKIPLNVAQLDVNDNSSVDNAIGNIVRGNGRRDILVSNAGYDLFGSLEESSLEEIKQQLRQMSL